MSWYALGSYNAGSDQRVALVLGSSDAPRIFDFETAYRRVDDAAAIEILATVTLAEMLHGWHAAQESFAHIAAAAIDLASQGKLHEIPDGIAAISAPIRPPRIFAAASNYVEHAKEMGTVLAQKSDSNPYMFIKASTAVVGPGDTVVIPAQTEKADWEVELAAVIGRPTRRVSVAEALGSVVGYTIVNDVSCSRSHPAQ